MSDLTVDTTCYYTSVEDFCFHNSERGKRTKRNRCPREQVKTGEELADFVEDFTSKLNAVADEVEKAHSTKLERQAP